MFILLFGIKMFYDIKNQEVKHPAIRCGVFMFICCLFSLVYGAETQSMDNVMTWLTAFFLELVLSFDNLAVILLIMLGSNLTNKETKLVLNYGIFGAVVMRILMLSFGVGAVSQFAYILFPIFGLYLGKVGFDMLRGHEGEKSTSWLDKPISTITNWVKQHKALSALLPVGLIPIILQVEGTDLLFAVDSIPAVLALSSSLPIVITSNLAAISFLRELYFVFEELQRKLEYLSVGVAWAIVVIALKLLAYPVLHHNHIELPAFLSFVLVLTPILVSVIISLIHDEKRK